MSKKVKCTCGASAAILDSRPLGVGATEDATGFHAVFNIRNGLEVLWLCPACWALCQSAANTFKTVFGGEAEYIHYSTFFRKG